MSVAGFVLGLIATVLAVVSLGWQVVVHRHQGARPRLSPVIGLPTADGLITTDAGGDVRESLMNAAEQLEDGQRIIGVKVVNAGRVPFHVAGWAMRSEPDGASLIPVEDPNFGTELPYDIPAGDSAVFVTELGRAHRFADAARGLDNPAGQQRHFVFTVFSGARTYATKPLSSELFSLESAMPEPDDQ